MDQFGSIAHFLEDKNVLVLGAAGFLAKSNSLSMLTYLCAYTHTNK